MSLLSATRLHQLIEEGVLRNVLHDQVNAASIDLRLGPNIMYEREQPVVREVSLRERERLQMGSAVLDPELGYRLNPREFILAETMEEFHLPNTISGQFQLKSSGARVALEHLKAGWCDAGWHGSVLTLELLNVSRFHAIRLRPGDRIGQIALWEHEPVPHEDSYATKGSYNNDRTVSGAKPK